MKRGFLLTARYKKAIGEVGTQVAPPKQKSARQEKPSSPPSRRTAGGVEEDVMDVDRPIIEQPYADDQLSASVPRSIGGNPWATSQLGEGENNVEAPYESPTTGKDANGNEMKRAVDDELHALSNHDSSVICFPAYRPPPGRRGWGRKPSEKFLHTVPESHGGPHKKRAVFLLWRRDRNAKPILSTDRRTGKLSPDGNYPWGETLFDFFYVNRLPSVPKAILAVTGSAIYEIMKAMGELDVSMDEIEWVKSEGVPRVEGAADTEELISCRDAMLHLMGPSKPNSQDQPSHSESWPTPFENSYPILLQERIPLYLLPKTLHVHDPFNLLCADQETSQNTSWTSRPDIVRTYNLNFSSTGSAHSQAEEERRKVEELEEFKARTLIILRYHRTKEQIKNHEPVIEVPLPPYSRRLTKVEEGHLYLSPIAKVGNGHHSVVYKGEWELPRDIFVKKSICRLCFEDSAKEEIQRLKDTGRYQEMLDMDSWGPRSYTRRKPTRAEPDEVNDSLNLESDGEIIEREVTCVISPELAPSHVVEMLEADGAWDSLMQRGPIRSAVFKFTKRGEDDDNEIVPIIRINPPYSSQKPCTHGEQHPVSRTARFTVVAKLSIENDDHLVNEAHNYQMFPEHFFEHYNGYIIVSQLHTIVPVHAIVPQFYGYYTPTEGGQSPYLSPILLLEHCGQPIEPEELSDEDQEECASMLLRFQEAGWLHESVAPRNFLVQHGKPTEFPQMRKRNPELSFRLIDFGRSRKWETKKEKKVEEFDVLEMFENLRTKRRMSATLVR